MLTVGVVHGAMWCVLLLMLGWEVLAGLGCAMRSHHLAVVLVVWRRSVVRAYRVAVVVLVGSAVWALVSSRSHRNTVVGAVDPAVESWALRRWRGHFGRRVVALARLHEESLIPLLRNFATLSLAWRGGRGPRRVLLLVHIWIRKASPHSLRLLESHLLMLIWFQVIVGKHWPWRSTPVDALRFVLCGPPRRPLAFIDLRLFLVLYDPLRRSVLLRVLPVAVLPVIFVDEVALVRNEADDHIVVAELPDLVQPIAQVYERLHVADVVDKECADGEPVVRGRDAQELLGS